MRCLLTNIDFEWHKQLIIEGGFQHFSLVLKLL
jgi:hypothetical protein